MLYVGRTGKTGWPEHLRSGILGNVMKLWQATSKHERSRSEIQLPGFAMQPCSLLPQRNGTIPG